MKLNFEPIPSREDGLIVRLSGNLEINGATQLWEEVSRRHGVVFAQIVGELELGFIWAPARSRGHHTACSSPRCVAPREALSSAWMRSFGKGLVVAVVVPPGVSGDRLALRRLAEGHHQAVIPAIRRHAPDSLIVCGTQTWSQDVDKAARDPLKFPNVAYALHVYAATHKQRLRDKAAAALVERAKELVKASRADYLILRDSHRKWHLPELVTNEDHCTLLVKLTDDPDRIWKGVNRRVRQSTKRMLWKPAPMARWAW